VSETTLPPIVPAFDLLATALAKAQGVIENPKKDRTVKVTTRTGGIYEFSYATLDAIMSAIKKPLSDNGLALVQRVVMGDKGMVLATELLHESGQRISSILPLNPAANDAQSLGSAITYMRRYAICALVGVVADEDDDGNMADGNNAKPVAPVKPRPAAAAIKRDEATAQTARAEVAEVLGAGAQDMALADRVEVLSQSSIEDMLVILAAMRQATKNQRAFYQQETHEGAPRWMIVDANILTAIGRVKNGGPVNTWLDQIIKSSVWRLFCQTVIKTADLLGVEVAR
jgi:hypothetical protein